MLDDQPQLPENVQKSVDNAVESIVELSRNQDIAQGAANKTMLIDNQGKPTLAENTADDATLLGPAFLKNYLEIGDHQLRIKAGKTLENNAREKLKDSTPDQLAREYDGLADITRIESNRLKQNGLIHMAKHVESHKTDSSYENHPLLAQPGQMEYAKKGGMYDFGDLHKQPFIASTKSLIISNIADSLKKSDKTAFATAVKQGILMLDTDANNQLDPDMETAMKKALTGMPRNSKPNLTEAGVLQAIQAINAELKNAGAGGLQEAATPAVPAVPQSGGERIR